VLIKRAERQARRDNLAGALPNRLDEGVDRRSFLRRSGLAAGGLATLGALQLGSVRKAKAGPPPPAGAVLTRRKNVCTHCSVGCSVIAGSQMVCGLDRSLTTIARSIAGRTAARVRPSVTMS